MATVLELSQAAGRAAASGAWEQAERLWSEVLQQQPEHVPALYSLGVHAFRRGRMDVAMGLLQRAGEVAPADPMIPLSISVIHRQAGRVDQEWAAIMRALSIDAYSVHGLLSKAEFLERNGRGNQAAAVYRDALKIAPEPCPGSLVARLAHARAEVERESGALWEFLQAALADVRGELGRSEAGRWDEAMSIMAGRSRPYLSQCNQLHVPRLPAIPFFEPGQFPWIEALQVRTGEIREELVALVGAGSPGFSPYVAYRAGDPVNQWGSLNHSMAWSAFHLWRHGEPVADNIARCPQTAEAMAQVDAAHIGGLCPNVMFSALAPHTVIPPHHGETNARLVAHLPLIVPPGCSFRVGSEARCWEEGRVLVFDDTIEHEARNDGDQLRVVVIFDVWNPLLSPAERKMVGAMSSAMREFRAQPGA